MGSIVPRESGHSKLPFQSFPEENVAMVSSPDPNLEETLLRALAPLEARNIAALNVLRAYIKQEFFWDRQTQRPLKRLAQVLLEAIAAPAETGDES